LKKLPAKIQAIKNLFKGDNDYTITTAIDPESKHMFYNNMVEVNG